MTVSEYKNKIREITADTHLSDVHTSPDFQCDQTDGFPTSLCVCWAKGVAWLELNTSLSEDDEDITPYEQMCADFGIRDCGSVEEYNSILQELGRDAYILHPRKKPVEVPRARPHKQLQQESQILFITSGRYPQTKWSHRHFHSQM